MMSHDVIIGKLYQEPPMEKEKLVSKCTLILSIVCVIAY